MSLLGNLLNDPPPAAAFEVSERGVAFARTSAPQEVKFHPLPAGAIQVSPLHDNVQQPEALASAVAQMMPAQPGRKRRAALILPDFTARFAVLDFDALPDNAEEQRALIRFRVKKSVPFDLESAVMSYHAQPRNAGRKVDVVVAVIAREVVSHYEDALRSGGFHAGQVVTSSIAALNLLSPAGITVFAKLSGRSLSVIVLDGPALKLARCVELEDSTSPEIMSVLHPTMVFVEDELGSRAARIVTCGFPADQQDLAPEWIREWGVTIEPLRSRLGELGPNTAGLLGYMESLAA